MYRYILFDFDGTLVDPGPAIPDSAQYALKQLGIDEDNQQNLRRFVGPPLEHTFEEFYALDDAQIIAGVAAFREYFRKEGIQQYAAYPGIKEMLQALRDDRRVPCIVTTKQIAVDQILKTEGLDQFFEHVVTRPMDSTEGKAVTIERALNLLDHPPKSEVVMVGDRKHDLIGAQSAGIDSIGVLYGYGSREEIEAQEPTHIAPTVADLTDTALG